MNWTKLEDVELVQWKSYENLVEHMNEQFALHDNNIEILCRRIDALEKRIEVLERK